MRITECRPIPGAGLSPADLSEDTRELGEDLLGGEYPAKYWVRPRPVRETPADTVQAVYGLGDEKFPERDRMPAPVAVAAESAAV